MSPINKHLERLRRMHRIIKFKRSGTPKRFAAMLAVSPSTLYQLITEMKALGAPIYYCQQRECYAYYEAVELEIGFTRLNGTGSPAVVRSLPEPQYAA